MALIAEVTELFCECLLLDISCNSWRNLLSREEDVALTEECLRGVTYYVVVAVLRRQVEGDLSLV